MAPMTAELAQEAYVENTADIVDAWLTKKTVSHWGKPGRGKTPYSDQVFHERIVELKD